MNRIIFDPDFQSMNDADYWDFRAKDYSEQTSEKLDPMEEKKRIIQGFFDKGILKEDSRVLDLGCGPGWYSRVFAQRTAEVVGIDISENMLEYARQNTSDMTNVRFYQMDWSKADSFFLGKFDLVFGNMSPAIYDDITLNKMMSACRGYCWYSHFATRYCNIAACLDEYYHIERKLDRIRFMFDYLWEHGFLPEVSFQRKGGTPGRIPMAEIIDYYRHEYHYPQTEDHKIQQLLKKFEVQDGIVERTTWFDKGILCWKVSE